MTNMQNTHILRNPIGILATWFGSGLSPKAPGTMGTLAALPFAFAIQQYISFPHALLVVSIVISITGVWISDRYMKAFDKEHDPKEVVIDEVAGIFITIYFVTNIHHNIDILTAYAVSFVLFRLFDIVKPFPISWADKKVSGGLGIMLDDILAGIIAAMVAILAFYLRA